MTCEAFDRTLDALLDGTCDAGLWREAEAHAAGCERCHRLFEALAGRGEALDEGGETALTDAIMGRTSGATCESARERLCDFVDDVLEPFDRELVGAHLERCAPCAALADAVRRATEFLPSFAELTPPSSLAGDVLRATSRRPAGTSLVERLRAWVARAAQRPRFSYEVAYALTLVLILVVGDPVRAVRSLAARGAFFVEPRVEAAAKTIEQPLIAARDAGARTVEAVRAKMPGPPAVTDEGRLARIAQWWEANVSAPVRAMLQQVSQWGRALAGAVRQSVTKAGARPAASAEPPAEPPRLKK